MSESQVDVEQHLTRAHSSVLLIGLIMTRDYCRVPLCPPHLHTSIGEATFILYTVFVGVRMCMCGIWL